MAVPTGGINRYQISNQIQDKTLFTQIQEEGDTFDPLLLFLLGYNFCKFEDNYEGKSFLELAKIMQRSIGGKLLNKPELQKTYKTLYEQEYLSDVLNLQWFKRYKEDFEEEHEAISLMKKNPRVKQKKREENKDCPFSPAGLSKSPKSVEPEVIPEEGDFQQIPSFLMNGDISGQENNEGMDSFQNYQQIIAQQEKIEQEKKLREEEESKKLIEQLLAQEEEQEQRAKEAAERQERESILAAQEIQKQFDEEAKLRRHEEEEKNKPE